MIQSILRSSVVATGVFALAGLAQADVAKPAEWGMFRGPNHDGTGPAPKGVRDWKQVKLSPLWKQETPAGFSSFAVAGGKVYTIVTRETEGNSGETLVCLSVKDGKEIWAKPLTVVGKYKPGGGDAGTPDNGGGDGPRSTPTVDGGNGVCDRCQSGRILLRCRHRQGSLEPRPC